MTRAVYRAGVTIYKHLPEPIQELIWTRMKSRTVRDRRYLEDVILPAFCAMRPQRVLFVGTRRYTRHYGEPFEQAGAEYWTLELLPSMAKFGSRRHITGSVLDADRLFAPAFFDMVLLNGVFGWGVNQPEHQETALAALWSVLKPDGILLLGYNNDRVPDPLQLEIMKKRYLHGIPGLPPRVKFETESHVYDFFRKIAPPEETSSNRSE